MATHKTGRLVYGALFSLVAVACGSEVTDEGEGGEGGAGDGGGTPTTTATGTGSGTGGSTTTSTWTGSTTSTSSYIPCPGPEPYPESCAEIPYFECGFWASCEGSTAKASWHEHIMCGSMGEEIYSYECSYSCPEACDANYSGWPESGAQLVSEICISWGSGGSGAGGADQGSG